MNEEYIAKAKELMLQDENALNLFKISGVDYNLILVITERTTLSSKDLLDFYCRELRFPTIKEMDLASKIGFFY